MQEIKKTRIVIASVLKPVDDTRMFEKMGSSLASTGKAEVHIIGFPSENTPVHHDITFYPLRKFTRLSIRRITVAWSITRLFLQLKPDVIIVSTHELLLGALLTKFVRRSRVIYDIRENYFRNIVYTNAFPSLLRWAVALHVRFKEIATSPFIDHFILAEQGYDLELSFVGPRKAVIENKLKRPAGLVQQIQRRAGSKLLFSGTLAPSTGVFHAIELAAALHAVDSSISLTIIGYAAKEDVRRRIIEATQDKPFVRLVGISVLVPHTDIIKAIQAADAGIISYPRNRSTESSIPTKLYEYHGCTLPIMIVDHKPWTELCDLWDAAIVIPSLNFDAPEFLMRFKQTEFYSKLPENVFWEDEQRRLSALILG